MVQGVCLEGSGDEGAMGESQSLRGVPEIPMGKVGGPWPGPRLSVVTLDFYRNLGSTGV